MPTPQESVQPLMAPLPRPPVGASSLDQTSHATPTLKDLHPTTSHPNHEATSNQMVQPLASADPLLASPTAPPAESLATRETSLSHVVTSGLQQDRPQGKLNTKHFQTILGILGRKHFYFVMPGDVEVTNESVHTPG